MGGVLGEKNTQSAISVYVRTRKDHDTSSSLEFSTMPERNELAIKMGMEGNTDFHIRGWPGGGTPNLSCHLREPTRRRRSLSVPFGCLWMCV